MTIIETLIVQFANKVLSDIEKLSDELKYDADKPIASAQMQLNNQEIGSKIARKQYLLTVLKSLV